MELDQAHGRGYVRGYVKLVPVEHSLDTMTKPLQPEGKSIEQASACFMLFPSPRRKKA